MEDQDILQKLINVFESNYINGYNFGNNGGNYNTVINYISFSFPIFQNTRPGKAITKTTRTLMFLEVFNSCSDAICEEIDDGLKHKSYPIKVDMTDTYDYCARLLYQNDATDPEFFYEFVNSYFGTLAFLNLWNFDVRMVQVMSHIYYELTPAR